MMRDYQNKTENQHWDTDWDIPAWHRQKGRQRQDTEGPVRHGVMTGGADDK